MGLASDHPMRAYKGSHSQNSSELRPYLIAVRLQPRQPEGLELRGAMETASGAMVSQYSACGQTQYVIHGALSAVTYSPLRVHGCCARAAAPGLQRASQA